MRTEVDPRPVNASRDILLSGARARHGAMRPIRMPVLPGGRQDPRERRFPRADDIGRPHRGVGRTRLTAASGSRCRDRSRTPAGSDVDERARRPIARSAGSPAVPGARPRARRDRSAPRCRGRSVGRASRRVGTRRARPIARDPPACSEASLVEVVPRSTPAGRSHRAPEPIVRVGRNSGPPRGPYAGEGAQYEHMDDRPCHRREADSACRQATRVCAMMHISGAKRRREVSGRRGAARQNDRGTEVGNMFTHIYLCDFSESGHAR